MKRKINHLLVERRWQRKAMLSLILLSFLIVIGVGAMLVMPAISLEGEDSLGNTYPYTDEQIINKLSAHLFKPNITQVDANKSEEDTAGEIAVEFKINYDIQSDMFKNGNRYIYYNLNDSIVGNNASFVIPDDGIPSTGMGSVTLDGGEEVGKYRIEASGLVVILFNDDFSQKMQESTYDEKGYISFTAGLSRNEGNEDDEVTLDFSGGGNAATVKVIDGFAYSNVTVDKKVTQTIDPEQKKITWTVTINNPDESNLKDLSITDTMLVGATNISCSASTSNTENAATTGKISLGNCYDKEITLTYETDISSDYNAIFNGKNYNNTVKVVKTDADDDAYVAKGTAGTYVSPQVSVAKSGTIQYGDDEDTITWTITIDNPNGFDLEGYKIKDDKFTSLGLGDLEVNGSDSNSLGEGVFTINGTCEEKQITITYTTTGDKETADDYENKVKLASPDGNQSKEAKASVPMDGFSLTKTGAVVSGKAQIQWTVKITDNVPTDDDTFGSLLITDDMLLSVLNALPSDQRASAFLLTRGSSTAVSYDFTYDSETGNISGIRIQSSDALTGVTDVTLTYTTDAVVNGFSTPTLQGGSWVTKNTAGITDQNGKTTTSTTKVTYTPRREISKSDKGASLTNQRNTLRVKWSVTLYGEEGGFIDGVAFTDTMSAYAGDDALSHTFDSIVSVVTKTAAGEETTLTENQYSVESTADGFKLNLVASEFTEEELNAISTVVITYYTDIDIEDLESDTVVTYKNAATAWEKTKEVESTYEVKSDVRLEKSAAGDSNVELSDLTTKTITINGVPTECYLLEWQVALNENGYYVGGFGNVYEFVDTLPEGYSLYTEDGLYYESGYNYYTKKTITLYSEDQWGSVTYELPEQDGKKQVKFRIQGWSFNNSGQVYLYYATYIPVSALEEAAVEAKQSGTEIQVTNKIEDSDGVSDEATISIDPSGVSIPEEDQNLIKTAEQNDAGAITYTIDFNADKLDMNPYGDTVTLKDIFNFGSVGYDDAGNVLSESPSDLLNVSLSSIQFYEADGETLLTPQPTYSFDGETKTETTAEIDCTMGESVYLNNSYSYTRACIIDNIQTTTNITVLLKTTDGNVIDENLNFYIYAWDESDYQTWVGPTYTTNQLDATTWEVQLTVTPRTDATVAVHIEFGSSESADVLPTTASATTTTYTKDADATLTMTVPDEKHIKIVYTYQAASSSALSVPNTVNRIETYGNVDSHTASKRVTYNAYSNSQAGVQSDYLIISKSDIDNSALNLDAGFILQRYNNSSGEWEYAQGITMDSYGVYAVTDWSTSKPDQELFNTSTDREMMFRISLEENTVYYLEEVRVPDGYDESKLENTYFVYDSIASSMKSLPSAGVDGKLLLTDKILNLASGNTLTIKNTKLPKEEYVLPETGGSGTGGYVGAGAFITIMAAFILAVRRRKAVYDKL